MDFAADIIAKVEHKNRLGRFVLMLISVILSALVYNLLILPINLDSGGVSGIAVITKYVYGFNPAIIIFIISMFCVLLSFMYLDLETTIGTAIASALYPIFIELTSPLINYVNIDVRDIFILVIYAGVIGGIANGLMYRSGYSNGGIPVISQILYKYHKISIAKSNLIINTIIVILGGFFFGWTMVMYAIILLYINSIIIDKVLLGISSNKAFYIVTTEDEAIKDYVIDELHHSVTTFDVKGAFLEKKRKVLLIVVPSSEYFKVTEGIKELDKDAFFVVTDSYQVEGGK
jgi:uncharacterized membrane-anchored protein YitT (DUF2179 family)